MSELFILAQDTSILNLEKIQRINVLGGTVVDADTGEEIEAIEIAATMDDNENTEIPLGIYLTEEQASNVMEELVVWLSEKNEYRRVFKMPLFEDKESTTNDETDNDIIGLDYSL